MPAIAANRRAARSTFSDLAGKMGALFSLRMNPAGRKPTKGTDGWNTKRFSGLARQGDCDRWEIMRAARYDWTTLPKRQLYLAFACLSAALSLASGMPQSLWSLRRIAEAPAMTVGVVANLRCRDHGHVDYMFKIEGSPVAGAQSLVDGVACQDLHAGQRITVCYETTDPTNNYAFAARDEDGNRAMKAFWVGLAFVAGFMLVGPLFLLLVVKTFSRIAALLE